MRLAAVQLAAITLAGSLAGSTTPAHAADWGWSCDSKPLTWIQSNCEGARGAWRSDDYDVYLFGHAHHGRSTYSEERLKELNERAWGGGLGQRFVDTNDRTHLIYAVAFADSHSKPEYMAGYGWLAHWRPFDGGFRVGLGFTAFITLRSDYSSYLAPVPGILPLGELAYKRASLMATYIPRLSGNEGNGDVLMIFGRISF